MTPITGRIAAIAALLVLLTAPDRALRAAEEPDCAQFKIQEKAAKPFKSVTLPADCKTRISNGFVLPDPNCAPGAINPSLTVEVLRNPHFRTFFFNDQATTE